MLIPSAQLSGKVSHRCDVRIGVCSYYLIR